MRHRHRRGVHLALEGAGQLVVTLATPLFLLLLVFGPEVDAICSAIRFRPRS